jgi:hypothetical protein
MELAIQAMQMRKISFGHTGVELALHGLQRGDFAVAMMAHEPSH